MIDVSITLKDLMYLDTLLLYSTPLKISYLAVLLPSVTAMIAAILSAKQLGGKLGKGLKLVAAGTIIYVILYVTIIAKEILPYETMSVMQLRLFFVASNLIGSVLLITGFYQIYIISKRLKLF